MKIVDQMRQDIGDWICEAQTADSYYIGNAEIHWVPGRQEFMLIPSDGNPNAYGSGYELVELIAEEDILAFYPEIAEYYKETAE